MQTKQSLILLVLYCALFFTACTDRRKYNEGYTQGAYAMAVHIDTTLAEEYKLHENFLKDSLPIFIDGNPEGGKQYCEGLTKTLTYLREEFAKDSIYARAKKDFSPPTTTR